MPKENFTEELKKVLISEIEVSEERASEILEKTKLSAIKPEELRERLKFLKNEIGYTNNEISKVVDKFDRVLSYNVQKMSSALKEFSDCFGTELEESKAYFREEIRCIGYDYKKIKTNKEEFEQVYKKYNKGKAFSKSPKSLIHLAMQDEDRRKKRQEFISKNLNVSLDEAILLMIEFPPSSSIREDVFLDKIAMAEKLMGYKDYVVQNPYILTANPIDLKFRFAMFAIECKTIGDFAKRKFFAFSTSKIWSRFEYLKDNGRKPSAATVMYSEAMFKAKCYTDSNYIESIYPFNEDAYNSVVNRFKEMYPEKDIDFTEEDKKFILRNVHNKEDESSWERSCKVMDCQIMILKW